MARLQYLKSGSLCFWSNCLFNTQCRIEHTNYNVSDVCGAHPWCYAACTFSYIIFNKRARKIYNIMIYDDMGKANMRVSTLWVASQQVKVESLCKLTHILGPKKTCTLKDLGSFLTPQYDLWQCSIIVISEDLQNACFFKQARCLWGLHKNIDDYILPG